MLALHRDGAGASGLECRETVPDPPKNVGNERVLTVIETQYLLTQETLARADRGEQAPGGLRSGQRYEERRVIGHGGLGEVVEAFDRDLNRRVALKRPRPGRGQPSYVARLVEEAQITAQLDHPNVPPIHSLGIDAEGRPYFSMALIEGRSLADLIAARRSDPAVAREYGLSRLLRMFLQVGNAVAFAHDRGVIHRDLKPDNILLGRFGEVRVLDWGLAKLLGRGEEELREGGHHAISTTAERAETQIGTTMGTPGYMSPEQALGRPDLDQRTDVYSLGAVLYAMLSGRPPIVADNPAELLKRTIEGKVVSLDEVAPVPADLLAVVHKALTREPGDRYADVASMLGDVEAILEDRPISLDQGGLIRRAGRFYISRNARFARLRFMDLDLMWLGAVLWGVAAGLWLSGGHGPWPWALAAAGLALHVPVFYTGFRPARPDDPGAPVVPYASSRPGGASRPPSP
jgi:eukaryotic-like serine/threonine-protein kinase